MTNTDTPAVKPVDSHEKFEAVDVAAWLHEEQTRANIRGLALSIHGREHGLGLGPVQASIMRFRCDDEDVNVHEYGNTVSEAITNALGKLAPADLAAKKRADAARLLREAERLESEASKLEAEVANV